MNVKNYMQLGLIFISLASVPSGQAQTQVKVSTTLGEFTLELFDTAAPGTVANFLNYVTSGRFNESVVHRSVPSFVIQGGQYVIPAGTT
jgi:peptidyl-prolyl cis-trans isomerase A (cyclophilin A)